MNCEEANQREREKERKTKKKRIYSIVQKGFFIEIQFIYYLFANAVNFSIKIAEQTIFMHCT